MVEGAAMKDYLGDSVYIEWDGYSLVLTTDNGFGPSNTIEFDSYVYQALLRFVERVEIEAELKKQTKPEQGKANA
jgi:hypothetical protein